MNFGEERHYQRYVEISSTDGRKVRELPSFYTEFEGNKDPPGIFFSPVSTVNIPDTKANATVLPNERKKKFDWLKHAASLSEFAPDTSWSVYNARRNKADIVPYFNSILLLMRQNVADFTTQKHCIEIVDSAITLLNPWQTIVDTNDRPVYSLSKRLQLMYLHRFGQ